MFSTAPVGVVHSSLYPIDPCRAWITGKCVIFAPVDALL
jgi:hypothetical protein